jgi:phosphoribosylformylglycinamidine synthase PurS subunit
MHPWPAAPVRRKIWLSFPGWGNVSPDLQREFRSEMKAKIVITPKKAVLDPQGKTVQNALAHLGYTDVGAVHVGKYLEIELTGTDRETARKQLDDACHKILSNPVIEDYRFEIVD